MGQEERETRSGNPSDSPRSGSSQMEQCTYIVTGGLLKSATL